MTALSTIYEMQVPIAKGFFKELCSFECIPWACVMATALLGESFSYTRSR